MPPLAERRDGHRRRRPPSERERPRRPGCSLHPGALHHERDGPPERNALGRPPCEPLPRPPPHRLDVPGRPRRAGPGGRPRPRRLRRRAPLPHDPPDPRAAPPGPPRPRHARRRPPPVGPPVSRGGAPRAVPGGPPLPRRRRTPRERRGRAPLRRGDAAGGGRPGAPAPARRVCRGEHVRRVRRSRGRVRPRGDRAVPPPDPGHDLSRGGRPGAGGGVHPVRARGKSRAQGIRSLQRGTRQGVLYGCLLAHVRGGPLP
mmetsp:Transcript_39570/g.77338  ORF Transcript_39570/g.77338 Transcript_39570/m.77338 type:complete len:258 (-) Transcript_39570:102-875(-)